MRLPSKSTTIRALNLFAACALAALATGCGTMVRDDFETAPSVPALQAAYLEVPAAELQRHCGTYATGTLYGCAKRDFKRKVCTIVTGPQPAVWLLDHERKHCAGYDHGPVTPAGSRTAAFEAHH